MRWDFWRRKQRDSDLDDEIAHDLAQQGGVRRRVGQMLSSANSDLIQMREESKCR